MLRVDLSPSRASSALPLRRALPLKLWQDRRYFLLIQICQSCIHT